jgi:leucyl aminopeptidase (aminopeptidase T)
MDLAQACLIAGLNVTKNCQLLAIRKMQHSEKEEFNQSIHQDLVNVDEIIGLCDTRFMQTNTCTCREASERGTRILSAVAIYIEEYAINGVVVGVDCETMAQNGNVICELWRKIKICRITSTIGTDISFCFRDRLVILGDGIVTEPGKIGFFPGVQVSIAPLGETINGRIVVDGSISPGGIVLSPVKLSLEKGVITQIEDGSDANAWAN